VDEDFEQFLKAKAIFLGAVSRKQASVIQQEE